MIEIFSTPDCRPCIQNVAWMDKNGIEYVKKDVTDPAIRAEYDQFGLTTVPVLRRGDDVWTGFNPKKLRELIA